MKHRGEIIEKAIRESGIPITEVARRIRKSRQWMYNLFENPNVSTDVVHQIGKIILYDFSEELELNFSVKDAFLDEAVKYSRSGSADFWRDKYYALLEEYLELMKKKKDSEG